MTNSPTRRPFSTSFWIFTAVSTVTLAILFSASFQSEKVLFSNDGPLGANVTASLHLPRAFSGYWPDIHWLGANGGTIPPDVTFGLFWLLGPVYLAKFLVPLSLLIAGFSARYLFLRLGLGQMPAALAGIATALNTNSFSNACWGLSSRTLTFACILLALGSVGPLTGRLIWLRLILAGFGVGFSIMEGADVGAIFSLYVAAYVFFISLNSAGKNLGGVVKSISRVALVAICAAILAAQSLMSLVSTQIQGVAGAKQDQMSKEGRWDWATQWSLPKTETLRVVIPGLFGYRTAEPAGSEYWGTVGRQPGFEQHHQGFPRHSGSGEYAGVLVMLIAVWGLIQSFARKTSPFTPLQRNMIWFWAGAAGLSLLLAFGRHAPVYQIIYQLPYFSTIRNPIKFMHPFHLSVLILFAFGLHGLSLRFLGEAKAKTNSFIGQIKLWWTSPTPFDRRFVVGSLALLVFAALGFLIFSTSHKELLDYLTKNGFEAAQAEAIVKFSSSEAALFVVFLALSVGLLIGIISSAFSGPRARWAAIAMGALLIVDLSRADLPWMKYYDYKNSYASNVVLDFLKDKPYEHRVAARVAPLRDTYFVNHEGQIFQGIYYQEWLQKQFPFYNIQVLDIPQFPRPPEIDSACFSAFMPTNESQLYLYARLWQLTNTRYILGMGGFVGELNTRFDPVQKSFQVRLPFNLVPKPGITRVTELDHITAEPNPNGPFVVFEFTNALPRAKLFSEWRVNTDHAAVLRELTAPDFDAHKLVFVEYTIPAASASATNQDLKPVEFVHYEPKRIELQSQAAVPTVLLLNDKYDPNWRVSVDGKPEKLLRCNFIMRGVQLSPGNHKILFEFKPSLTGLYISLAAIAVGFVLIGILIVRSE